MRKKRQKKQTRTDSINTPINFTEICAQFLWPHWNVLRRITFTRCIFLFSFCVLCVFGEAVDQDQKRTKRQDPPSSNLFCVVVYWIQSCTSMAIVDEKRLTGRRTIEAGAQQFLGALLVCVHLAAFLFANLMPKCPVHKDHNTSIRLSFGFRFLYFYISSSSLSRFFLSHVFLSFDFSAPEVAMIDLLGPAARRHTLWWLCCQFWGRVRRSSHTADMLTLHVYPPGFKKKKWSPWQKKKWNANVPRFRWRVWLLSLVVKASSPSMDWISRQRR